MATIRIRFMGSLKDVIGRDYVEVESDNWVEALIKTRYMDPRLTNIIDEKGEPQPGYMVFVDGVDYRIAERGQASEVILFPIVHGGSLGGKNIIMGGYRINC